MANRDEEKYGIVGSTIKNEVEKGVEEAVGTVAGVVGMAKNVGGFLKRDIKNGIDWLTASPEERAEAKKEEEIKKQEEEAKAEAEKAEQEAAKAAEDARMEELKTTYILHTAAITCTYAKRVSFVVIPVSHGTYIHGVEQLNVGDSVPEINIRNFGVCTSPENPSVKKEAERIAKEVKEREKGFMDRVMDIFSKKPKEEVSDELIAMCAGDCTPLIYTEWIDGKEDVLIDGKKAVLGKCKLECSYGGEIAFYTSGQKA
ncbi:DUF4280 domain-containing protein [Clostridium sp.]|uniref:DUF4280 domain-containing protein n=1 Tax=Clostridium sp. TaxID=1506 RepID=UPI003463F222